MHKVTTITPVFNRERFLNYCIDSLLNQTLDDVQIILVDDCSTDSSRDILMYYASLYPNVSVIFNAKNHGQGYTRNKALEQADGEYIRFVDSDDFIGPNSLKTMYDSAKEYSADMVLGRYNVAYFSKMKEQKPKNLVKPFTIDPKQYGLRRIPLFIADKLIARDSFDSVKFPEDIRFEDLALMPFIIAKSSSILQIDDPVYYYRRHLGSESIKACFQPFDSTEIFACLNWLKENFHKEGIYEQYKDELDIISITHILARVKEVVTWIAPNDEKRKLLNELLASLDINYPDWYNIFIASGNSKKKLKLDLLMNAASMICGHNIGKSIQK